MIRIRLTAGFLCAFALLTFALAEAHELVHTTLGRMLCGAWGTRDFNVWSLADGCRSEPIYYLPTYAGPVFTFAMIWLGAGLLRYAVDARWRSFGFCLIFADMPLARIATALASGGDEVYATRHLLGRPLGVALGMAAVLLLSVPPLIVGWRSIANRHRWAWFTGFFAGPLLLAYLVVFRGLNPLLERGILAQNWLPAEPALITVATACYALGLLLLWRPLFRLPSA